MPLTRLQSAPRPVTRTWGDPSRPMPCYLYPQVPGLAVTQWAPDGGGRHPSYGITHVASGARVGEWLYISLADAERALAAVADLLLWTQPLEVLRAELTLRAGIDPALHSRLAAALRPSPRSEVTR